MGTISSSFVLVNGQRYSYLAGTFQRSVQLVEVGNIVALRPESPFLDAQISDFSGGVKPDYLNDNGDWLASMLGMSPSSVTGYPPYTQLSIGRTLTASLNAAGAGPIGHALRNYRGALLAGEQGSDSIYRYNGTSWALEKDLGTDVSGVQELEEFRGTIYASVAGHGVVYNDDGTHVWGSPFDLGACDGIYVMKNVYTGNDPLLYVVASNILTLRTTKHATIFTWDGSALIGGAAPQAYLEERWCYAGVAAGSTLYVCGAEQAGAGGQKHGTIYSFNGTSLTPIAHIDSNYAVSAAEYRGKTYWGATNGEVYVLDGNNVQLLRKFASSQWVWGMKVFGDALWVPIYNEAATRIEMWRYADNGKGVLGWSMPHYVTALNSYTGGIDAYGDQLWVGAGLISGPATRRVYTVSGTDRATNVNMQTPYVVYGVPTMPKRFRRVLLEHTPLVAGQVVTALIDRGDGNGFATVLTNSRVNSTRTIVELPDDVRTSRLSLMWSITNLATLDFTATSTQVRGLPAPDGKYVWTATLLLTPVAGDTWTYDGTPDNVDALTKLDALTALRQSGQVFQFVEPWYDSATGIPKRAMLATFDAQTDLSASIANPGMDDVLSTLSARFLQAEKPYNLLENSSFEQSAVGTLPPGWFTGGVGGTAADVSTAVTPVDGTKVVRLVFNGSALTWRIGQTVAITPGRWHTLSGYIRRAMSSGNIALRVTEGATTYGTVLLNAATDAIFTRYSISFFIPLTSSGSVLFEFAGGATPGGTVYGDAFQLEEAVPASTYAEKGTG